MFDKMLDFLKKLDSLCVFAGMPVEPGCEEAFVQTWTKMVQEPAFLYLTGVNQQAAEYSGINTRAVIMSTYVLSAVSAAIAACWRGENIPKSYCERIFFSAATISEFPRQKEIRAPVVLKDLESEKNSAPTSDASGTERNEKPSRPSKTMSLYALSLIR